MAKKEEIVEEVVEETSAPVVNRITTDFHRTDLNELRDVVNELYRR